MPNTVTKTGYFNGCDMLLLIGGGAFGHCTTHTVSLTAETKERAVKPAATVAYAAAALWKDKSVTGLSANITAEGLVFYQEAESGYKTVLPMVMAGQAVAVQIKERGASDPYLSGSFIITKLDRTDPAGDDATYSIELQNNGPVTADATKLTEAAAG